MNWKNKTVLITGGAGFIGLNAVFSLVKKNAKIIAVVSPQISTNKIRERFHTVKNSVKVIRADLLDAKKCIEISKDVDIILNFAALDGSSMFKRLYPAKIFTTNMKIVQNILEAARVNSVERILLMSSIEVYSPSSQPPLKESDGLINTSKDMVSGYAWSKRYMEIIAQMYANEYGMKIAIARPGNIYGPFDHISSEKGRVIPTFISQVLQNKEITVIGKGIQTKSFLYIDDLITALLNLVDKYAVCDPVNIASKRYISIKDLAMLIDTLSKDKKNNKKVVKKKTNRIVSIKKAESSIKFLEKVSLEEGLKKTIAYFREVNEL